MQVSIPIELLEPAGWGLLSTGVSAGLAIWMDRRNRKQIEQRTLADMSQLSRNWMGEVLPRMQVLDQGLATTIQLLAQERQRFDLLEVTMDEVVQQTGLLSEQLQMVNMRSDETRGELGGIGEAIELLRRQAPLQQEFIRRRSENGAAAGTAASITEQWRQQAAEAMSTPTPAAGI